MENYFDLATLIVPVLVVLIGGGLAFWQMNYRNKQERINKWKEDFRTYMGEYTEVILFLNNELYRYSKGPRPNEKLLQDIWPESHKVMVVTTKIEMLLDSSNPHYKELFNCFRKQVDYMNDALGEKTENINSDLLSKLLLEAHFVAKKIHKEYKG